MTLIILTLFNMASGLGVGQRLAWLMTLGETWTGGS